MTIGERIKARREELGLTQQELAEKLGYKSKSSINKIELNIQNLTQSKIKSIAVALETTPGYIMGWNDTPTINGIYLITTQRVPLIGAIACGKPIEANEEFEAYVEVGAKVRCDYCVRAKGDSMINARIHNGDIVFIRKQEMVENGEIAAVLIDNEVTLKRFYYYPESNKLVLQAENPQFEPLVYVGEELNHVTILGKAVAFQSDIN